MRSLKVNEAQVLLLEGRGGDNSPALKCDHLRQRHHSLRKESKINISISVIYDLKILIFNRSTILSVPVCANVPYLYQKKYRSCCFSCIVCKQTLAIKVS